MKICFGSYFARSNYSIIYAYIEIKYIFTQVTQGASIEDFHIIGHSLGSQIAGYAGERIQKLTKQKLGRISGLDPAAPLFENMPNFVRLDPSDAIFVDVIHSDATDDGLNFGEYHVRYRLLMACAIIIYRPHVTTAIYHNVLWFINKLYIPLHFISIHEFIQCYSEMFLEFVEQLK